MPFRATTREITLLSLLVSGLLAACGSGDAGESPSATGDVQILREQPPSVIPNEGPESDSVMYLVPEKKGYELETPLAIDARDPDTLDDGEQLIDDSLAAGTTVDSYLLHFDKAGAGTRDVRRQGTLSLPAPLVGLMTRGKTLDATDGRLGAEATTYPEPGTYRSTEIGRTNDTVVIGPERRTLGLDLTTNGSADHLRILLRAP